MNEHHLGLPDVPPRAVRPEPGNGNMTDDLLDCPSLAAPSTTTRRRSAPRNRAPGSGARPADTPSRAGVPQLRASGGQTQDDGAKLNWITTIITHHSSPKAL